MNVKKRLEAQILLAQGSLSGKLTDNNLAGIKKELQGVGKCSSADGATIHMAHESDCSKFYHCVPDQIKGSRLATKNCSPGTLFNPRNLICDWPINVYKVKPSCRIQGN